MRLCKYLIIYTMAILCVSCGGIGDRDRTESNRLDYKALREVFGPDLAKEIKISKTRVQGPLGDGVYSIVVYQLDMTSKTLHNIINTPHRFRFSDRPLTYKEDTKVTYLMSTKGHYHDDEFDVYDDKCGVLLIHKVDKLQGVYLILNDSMNHIVL